MEHRDVDLLVEVFEMAIIRDAIIRRRFASFTRRQDEMVEQRYANIQRLYFEIENILMPEEQTDQEGERSEQ